MEDSERVDLSYFPVRISYGKLNIGGAWGLYYPHMKCTTCTWAKLRAALEFQGQDGTLERPVRISDCMESFKIPTDIVCKDAAEPVACEAPPAVKAAADAPEGEWDVVSRGGASDT